MQYSQFAKRGAIVLALLGGLAACGDDPTERALYGGAAGLGVATLTDPTRSSARQRVQRLTCCTASNTPASADLTLTGCHRAARTTRSNATPGPAPVRGVLRFVPFQMNRSPLNRRT